MALHLIDGWFKRANGALPAQFKGNRGVGRTVETLEKRPEKIKRNKAVKGEF